MMKTDEKSGLLRLTNTTGTSIVLVLEPWADEHPLAIGESLEVSYSGPAEGDIEIELQPGRIVIFGWTGSTLEVRPRRK